MTKWKESDFTLVLMLRFSKEFLVQIELKRCGIAPFPFLPLSL